MSLKLRLVAATLVGSMAATAAHAQNNNTGDIVIQGVVPGVWELTVYDITSGYDFDLSEDATNGTVMASTTTNQRVGTIHVTANTGVVGQNSLATIGTLMIESANAGRMINDQSIAGIAGNHQDYALSLEDNGLTDNSGMTVTLATGVFGAPAAYTSTAGGADLLNMNTPQTLEFTGGTEATYDVVITLGSLDSAGAITQDIRPNAQGVYSDTLTFTIMDDDT